MNNSNSGSIGCTPIRLEDAHLAELHSLIEKLFSDAQSSSLDEKNLERFEKLIQLYSEEPQLLDPALPTLINALLRFVSWPSPEFANKQLLSPVTKAALIRLRALSMVRGQKFLMRLLPHEFELLEPILASIECLANLLDGTSNSNTGSKQSNLIDKRLVHILTVWLYIICKNPFNLDRHSQKQQLFERRITLCMDVFQQHVFTIGELAIVPLLLAQILTRNIRNQDPLTLRFNEFKRIFISFETELDGGRTLINQLRLSIAILKNGRREELRPFVLELMDSLPPATLRANCPNILVRDLIAKLLQRFALVLLRPRLAVWRYRCGFRSLEDNLCGREKQSLKSIEKPIENETENTAEGEENVDEEIPYEQVEKMLGELLLKVTDQDNMVRWTAAKGVARICARIPLEMADEVISSLLNVCFGTSNTDATNAWHGGCLTLAELCRRGCLLPEQVPKVIDELLPRALTFEQSHLGFMQAVNVRDAACYICWAFARAYEPSILQHHLRHLADVLLNVALFDREVNIRRAASAAFQENVGRNDSFPHGIAILSIIDYIEVARIRHCYLDLSVQIAQFDVYVRPMLNCLCQLKSKHWDEAIRVLSGDALQRLAMFDSEYSFEKILPSLCEQIYSLDPALRHGAFFGISGLLIALAEKHDVFRHKNQLVAVIADQSRIVSDHRTRGFSLICKSLCRLIEALCSIDCELTDEELAQFHDILDIVVGEKDERIAEHAVMAFSVLMPYYKGDRFAYLLDRVQNKYFTEIEGPCQSEVLRCSSIIPLGHISSNLLSRPCSSSADEVGKMSLSNSILQRLLETIQDTRTPKWVYAKVAAIKTIWLLLEKFVPPNFTWGTLIDCLSLASDDYTSTTNGDIGRFARLASVKVLGHLLPLIYSKTQFNESPSIITRCQLDGAVGKMIERACESIDDLRENACTMLAQLCQLEDEHPLSIALSEMTLLRHIFVTNTLNGKSENKNPIVGTTTSFSSVDWRHAQGFIRLAPLLGSSTYGQYALTGFVLSAGSVCSWTSEHAFLAIAKHLQPHKQDLQFLKSFLANLLLVHSTIVSRQGDPNPVLVLFRMLLNDRQLHRLEDDPDKHSEFVALGELAIKLAVSKGRPKVKALAVSVLGSLLQLDRRSQLYRRVLFLLLSLLDSPYGSLREQAAEQLFESFSLLDCDAEDRKESQNISEAVELIANTDWSGRGGDGEFASIRERIKNLLWPL